LRLRPLPTNSGRSLSSASGQRKRSLFAELFDSGHINASDIVRLPNHEMFVRLMVEGMPRGVFSAEAINL